jgi:ATP-dependent Clp protease protease subunit
VSSDHIASAVPLRDAPAMRAATAGLNLTDSVYERLLRERIIVLGSQVEENLANQICAQLLLLSAEDPDRDIRLYINSPGGSVTAGMAIYDTMHLIEPDVATYAMGLAASMGRFLLSAGTRGKRYALPHARILMHQPSAGVSGTAADIAIQADTLIKNKREMAELIPRADRPAGRADHHRLRRRPLVHCGRGPRVRLRRLRPDPRQLAARCEPLSFEEP